MSVYVSVCWRKSKRTSERFIVSFIDVIAKVNDNDVNSFRIVTSDTGKR